MLKIAELQDVFKIIPVIQDFHQNSPYSDMPFEIDRVSEVLGNVIASPTGIVVYYEEDDIVKGIIGGVLNDSLFNSKKVANELFWWVGLDYRKSKIGFELLDAFEYWALKIAKADIIGMVGLSNFDTSKIYEKRGYSLRESTYLKIIEGGVK